MRLDLLTRVTFILFVAIASHAMAVSVIMMPNPKTAQVSQACTIGVNIDTATSIRGYGFNIHYNPTLLSFSQAARGILFAGQPVNWWVVNTDTPGDIRIECLIFGAGLSVTGPGNILNLTFTPLSESFDTISLSNIELYDANANTIPNVSSQNGYVIIGNRPAYFTAKCFLQGAYISGNMRTTINALIPHTSPFSADPVTVNEIPPDAVDWVLVQLRQTYNGSAIRSQSALLHSNGMITSPGKPFLLFMNLDAGNYYVVIKPRNHLPAMSNTPFTLISSGSAGLLDLTNISNVYGHCGMVQINGISTLAAGDANQDGNVYPTDRNAYWRVQTGQSGYKAADFNLDGNVYPSDLNGFWRPNSGMSSGVPLIGN